MLEPPSASPAFFASLAAMLGASSGGDMLRRGVLLGLGAAAPIGPVNIEIARRALGRGFFAGAALGMGAVSVDVVYAILSGLSLPAIFAWPAVSLCLRAASMLVLGFLGVLSLRAGLRRWKARHEPLNPEAGEITGSARTAYITGLLMTALNPMTLVFWFVAVPGAAGAISEDPRANWPMIGAGVFIGTIGWVVCFAGAMNLAGRRRKQGWLAAADAAGGLALLGFAAAAGWSCVRQVL